MSLFFVKKFDFSFGKISKSDFENELFFNLENQTRSSILATRGFQ